MSEGDIGSRYELMLNLLPEADAIALRWFRASDLRADAKKDDSPVTQADRNIEAMLRRRIEAAFPGDSILGEEQGETAGTTGYRWIIDPIDGTRSFARGIPTFGTLIAIEADGEPKAGGASFAALGETIHAAEGRGCWWKGREGRPERAGVSSTLRMSEALVESVAPDAYHAEGLWGVYEALSRAAMRLRGWNDAYAFTCVATGRVDASIDLTLKPWDIAPFLPIIEEAGGKVSDWTGRRSHLAPRIIASNGHLHRAMLDLVGGHGAGDARASIAREPDRT